MMVSVHAIWLVAFVLLVTRDVFIYFKLDQKVLPPFHSIPPSEFERPIRLRGNVMDCKTFEDLVNVKRHVDALIQRNRLVLDDIKERLKVVEAFKQAVNPLMFLPHPRSKDFKLCEKVANEHIRFAEQNIYAAEVVGQLLPNSSYECDELMFLEYKKTLVAATYQICSLNGIIDGLVQKKP